MPSVFGAFRGASMVKSFITTLLINKKEKKNILLLSAWFK
jgi:hypothetical protein